MSVQNITANCSLLAARRDFAGYVQQLNSTTGFNITLLEACKGDICNALWGDGNADISGIGMVIGYFLDSIIGFFLALSLAFHEPISTKPPITKHGSLLAEACKVFFDCAVFFAISIQISCVVVLVRRDFGISANGLGGLTVQITWAVALICMLPLIYPMLEQQVLSGFEAAGFIVITTYGLLSLLWFIITRRFPERAKVIRHKLSSTFPQANRKQNAIWCMNIAIPLLTIPQLWGVLRLRGVQKRLADATSNVYVDNQWTFGQVVAVMIFVPVFTEVGYLWIKERVET